MPDHILNALRTYMHGDGSVLLPEMQLFLFAAGILVMDSWATNKQRYWNPALAVAGIIFSALTLWMLRARITEAGELTGFHVTAIVDSYFLFFTALFLAATALVILLSINDAAISGARQGRHYALLLFACMGMMLMVSGIDLLVIFLGLEVLSISAYFLAATPGLSKCSSPAAVKFLISSALGSAMVAYGFSLLYGLTGASNIGQIASALARRGNVAKVIALSHEAGLHGSQMYQLLQSRLPEAVHWHPFMLEALPIAAFGLVAIGLILKIAALSFPLSSENARSGIPVSAALFLSGAFAVAVIALAMRLLLTIFADSQSRWWYILAASAIALIVSGIVASLRQTNLERILANASIAQIGFLLLGLVSANEPALTAMTYYLFTYLFIVSGAFATLVAARYKGAAAEDLSDLGGLPRHSPLIALLLIIFVLALAGVPPTAGFFGRYFIVRSLIETAHPVLAWFAAISALPLAYSYLRMAVYAWRSSESQTKPETSPPSFGMPEAIVLGVCVFVTLAAGLYSEPFTRMARYAFGQ
jgi:NADH-quinone oxidoreductase subunit N